MNRLAYGALGGLAATMAMTMAMRRMWSALPPEERYPLPPAELTRRIMRPGQRCGHDTRTTLAHFGYGALTGALFGTLPPGTNGPAYGVAVWALSYMGWVPALGLLRSAHRHPPRRNLLMILAHVVWGAFLSGSLRELERSSPPFDYGPAQDAPKPLLGEDQLACLRDA